MLKSDLKIGDKVITINKTNPNQGTNFRNFVSSNSGSIVGIVKCTTVKPIDGDVGLAYRNWDGISGGEGMYFMVSDLVEYTKNNEWYWTERLKKEKKI